MNTVDPAEISRIQREPHDVLVQPCAQSPVCQQWNRCDSQFQQRTKAMRPVSANINAMICPQEVRQMHSAQCHLRWDVLPNQLPSASSPFLVIPREPDASALRLIRWFVQSKYLWPSVPGKPPFIYSDRADASSALSSRRRPGSRYLPRIL